MAVVSKGVKNFGSKLLDMSSAARRKRARELGFDPDEVWYHGSRNGWDEDKSGPVWLTSDRQQAENYARGGDVYAVLARGNREPVDSRRMIAGEFGGSDALVNDIHIPKIGRRPEFNATHLALKDSNQVRSVNAAFDPAKKESRNLLASLAPVGIGTTVAAGGLLAPEEAEASVTGKLSKELAQRLAPHSQLLDAVVNERDSGIILDKLVVPKDQRGGGVGGRFMDDLTAYADESGKPLALTAAGDFGGTKAGQRRFYKRHGFVDNKGRNKDYEFSENMIRPAVVGGAAVASGGTIADEVAEQMDPARTRPGSFLLHGQGMENSMIPNHAGAMLISQGLDAIEDRTVPVLRPFLPTEHLGDVAEDKWAQGRASSALDKFLVWVDTI